MFQFLQYRKFHLYLNYFHDPISHVNIDFYTKRVINQKSYPILNNYI